MYSLLDKRSKKHNQYHGAAPNSSTPKVIALITAENYELIPYLKDRSFLARSMVLFGEGTGVEPQGIPCVHTWEEAIITISGMINDYLEEPPE